MAEIDDITDPRYWYSTKAYTAESRNHVAAAFDTESDGDENDEILYQNSEYLYKTAPDSQVYFSEYEREYSPTKEITIDHRGNYTNHIPDKSNKAIDVDRINWPNIFEEDRKSATKSKQDDDNIAKYRNLEKQYPSSKEKQGQSIKEYKIKLDDKTRLLDRKRRQRKRPKISAREDVIDLRRFTKNNQRRANSRSSKNMELRKDFGYINLVQNANSPVDIKLVDKSEIGKHFKSEIGSYVTSPTKTDNRVDEFLQWVDELPLVAYDGNKLKGVGEQPKPAREKSKVEFADTIEESNDENTNVKYTPNDTVETSNTDNNQPHSLTETETETGTNIDIKQINEKLKDKRFGLFSSYKIDIKERFNIQDDCKIDRLRYKFAIKSSLQLKTNVFFNNSKVHEEANAINHDSMYHNEVKRHHFTKNKANTVVCFDQMSQPKTPTNNLEVKAKSVSAVEKYSCEPNQKITKNHLTFNKIYNDNSIESYIRQLRYQRARANEKSPTVLNLTVNQSNTTTQKQSNIQRSLKSIDNRPQFDDTHSKKSRCSSKSAPEKLLTKSCSEASFKAVDIFGDIHLHQVPKNSDPNESVIAYNNFFPPKLHRSNELKVKPKEPSGFVLCPVDTVSSSNIPL